jgi:hypothetical protein
MFRMCVGTVGRQCIFLHTKVNLSETTAVNPPPPGHVTRESAVIDRLPGTWGNQFLSEGKGNKLCVQSTRFHFQI